MTGALVALVVSLAVAAVATVLVRRRIARWLRPPRFAHLTDAQWQVRRAVLLARRDANRLKEPPILHERYADDRAFGRLFPDDDGERVRNG